MPYTVPFAIKLKKIITHHSQNLYPNPTKREREKRKPRLRWRRRLRPWEREREREREREIYFWILQETQNQIDFDGSKEVFSASLATLQRLRPPFSISNLYPVCLISVITKISRLLYFWFTMEIDLQIMKSNKLKPKIQNF